jgi:hypothetical protein
MKDRKPDSTMKKKTAERSSKQQVAEDEILEQ